MNTLSDAASSPRGKWITIVIWFLVAGLIIPLSPTLSDISTNDTLQFLPGDSESTTAAELARERFPTESTPAIIVLRNAGGLTDEDFAAAGDISNQLQAMTEEENSNLASVVSLSTVPEAEAELLSPDETTMTIIAAVTGSPAEDAYGERIESIRDVTEPFDSGSLEVKVSGPGGLSADLVSVFSNIDTFLLLVTVALVLVLLIIIYRSPIVALVPIILVGIVFQLTNGIAALILDGVDFAVSGQTTGIMTVILFGAGTDYILFISARYREELRLTDDKHVAMRRAMRGVGGAVASAGGTLVAASMILLLANLGSFQSLGPAIAIAIILMMLAALTLVPAVLAVLGRFAFWPFRPQYDENASREEAEETSPIWGRIAGVVLARPATVLSVTGIALLVMIGGMTLYEPSYDSLESLPSDVDSVQGFELLREGFPAGQLAPTEIYVELPNGESALEPDNLERIQAIADAVSDVDGVASVSSPASPRGAPTEALVGALDRLPDDLKQEIENSRESGQSGPPQDSADEEFSDEIALYTAALGSLSTDLNIASLEVVLDVNPYGLEAMDLMPEIRDAARNAASNQDIPGQAILVGGETAQNYDTREATNRDTLIVLPLVLVAIMIILGLLLRSVVAALYLGITIIGTYFATLGLAIFCFRYIFGQDTVGSGIPFLLFVFLNALGVDYSIYLMSRIREEARNHVLETATHRALARTGGVITSAGLILAGTFGALMTLPLRDLFQLGFAVAIGVLIDTFVTRSLLVPSVVKLLGRWNWWPSDVQVENVTPRSSAERPASAGD